MRIFGQANKGFQGAALAVMLGSALAAGGCAGEGGIGKPSGQPDWVVPTTPEVMEITQGVSAWEVYVDFDGDGLEILDVIGVDEGGRPVAQTNVRATRDEKGRAVIDAQVFSPVNGIVRVTGNGELLQNDGSDAAAKILAAVVHDVTGELYNGMADGKYDSGGSCKKKCKSLRTACIKFAEKDKCKDWKGWRDECRDIDCDDDCEDGVDIARNAKDSCHDGDAYNGSGGGGNHHNDNDHEVSSGGKSKKKYCAGVLGGTASWLEDCFATEVGRAAYNTAKWFCDVVFRCEMDKLGKNKRCKELDKHYKECTK